MIGRKQEIYTQINQVIDALLLGATFWLSYWLRAKDLFVVDSLQSIPPFAESLWMLAIIMPFGPLLLEARGFYSQPLQKVRGKSLSQLLQAGVWLVLFLGLCVIFLRLEVPSRSVLLIFVLISPLALLLRERLARLYYFEAVRRGDLRESVLMAGEEAAIRMFWAKLPKLTRLQINPVDRVDLEKEGVNGLISSLHHHSVGRVIFCFRSMDVELLQKAVGICEIEGVEAWMSADFVKTSFARPTYETLSGMPMLVFRSTPDMGWSLLAKGALDRIVAACALVLLAPVFAVVAVAVRVTSSGPAFFRQERAGLHGKKFLMWKFRSMVADAEHRRKDLLEHNEMSGPVFKIKEDPRITPIGRFLRQTSIDELPQLINVLRGEMSLVGPRPLPTYEVAQFDQISHRRRLSMKPGLTCLWQVRGRNSVQDFDDWVRMDLEYIDNWSLALDLVILLRTIPAVLFGKGAK